MIGRAFASGVVALLLSLVMPAGTPGLTAAPGFRVSLWATDLGGVRLLSPTPAGDVLATDMSTGRLLLLVGGPQRKVAEVRVLLTGLVGPNSVDYADGVIYVGEANAVGKVGFDPQTRQFTGPYSHIASLISGGGHFSRTVRVGPDGWVYASAGSTCNVCLESDPERAAIIRMHPDGTGRELYATGLRNSVGFDWQPGTNDLYATENGRDLLGDDFPPDELNRIVKGGFYGWPFAHGDRVPDPNLGAGHDAQIASSIPPAHGFRAHNAALGFTFLRHASTRTYARAAVAALHGSWNRSTKDGYKVVSLHWQSSGFRAPAIVERDLLTGFLRPDGSVIGRPVGVAETPDGSIYVSDDYKHVVYRLTPTTP